MFHFFHRWGAPKDGHQCCLVCGLAKSVQPAGCQHEFEDTETHVIHYYNPQRPELDLPQTLVQQRCIFCGHRQAYNKHLGKLQSEVKI